ncbi:MAG: alkaline phosphatase family protein [Terracidiphilus sp.]|jgi:phospholipase C
MPANQPAFIRMQNSTAATCCIRLYHSSDAAGMESFSWVLAPAEVSSSAMTVHFDSGIESLIVRDHWWASLSPIAEPTSVTWYASPADPALPDTWDENKLESADEGATLLFTASESGYQVNLNSGSKTFDWQQMGGRMTVPGCNFTNIFVLMLENHSFDNILAFSGIPGIAAATRANSNSYSSNGQSLTVNVTSPAPVSMPTDPGHEFLDVVEQLCGQGGQYVAGSYPAVNNSGFAANYATSNSEKTGLPSGAQVADVLACFDTAAQLPVTYALATEFAVCDHWFSSLPGPTWPNRYFIHCASSAGLDDSPTSDQMAGWSITGLEFPNGSLYDRLNTLPAGKGRIYHDETGPEIGKLPQVTSIKGVSMLDVCSLDDFAADLTRPYPWRYTFIEPNFGDTLNNTYEGGSSQHPMDGVAGGEDLIKRVYEAIRNSPLWNESLLIVTYDEHGGFYDSVSPGPCAAPGDHPAAGLNSHGFEFTQLGVRVPAIVVSPRAVEGAVSKSIYDHSSVVATVTNWVGLGSLTGRDAEANTLTALLQGPVRTNCLSTLPNPVAEPVAAIAASAEMVAASDSDPLRDSGNHWGFLSIAAKTDYELSGQTPADEARIRQRIANIRTVGQAREYALEVKARTDMHRAKHRQFGHAAVNSQ